MVPVLDLLINTVTSSRNTVIVYYFSEFSDNVRKDTPPKTSMDTPPKCTHIDELNTLEQYIKYRTTLNYTFTTKATSLFIIFLVTIFGININVWYFVCIFRGAVSQKKGQGRLQMWRVWKSESEHLLTQSCWKRIANMEDFKPYEHFATDALHAGQEPEKWKSMAVVPPISMSTTFKQFGPGDHSVSF